MSNPVVVFGSSRHRGETWRAIEEVFPEGDVPIIQLRDLNITYYDYEHANSDDDFLPLMEKVLTHDPIILATPVYWYAMSAVMKTFVERWSDLLDIRRDLRSALLGKHLFMIASYAGEYPLDFETPMRLTCEYLGMQYGGCYFHHSGGNQQEKEQNGDRAESFRTSILGN